VQAIRSRREHGGWNCERAARGLFDPRPAIGTREARMCNDFGNRVSYRSYVEEFSHLRLPLVFPAPDMAPNLEPREEIWPTEMAPVIRPMEGGVGLVQLPWGLVPSRPKARAVINMRSEGRSFARGRCLVPASNYFEFTGTKSPKTRWRFTKSGEDWFCFAGLLGRGADADGGEGFTLLTTSAGADVAPYHSRQPVVLERGDWAAWLDGTRPCSDLLRPSPVGSLQVIECPRTEKNDPASLFG
jgi:putative SOS response-associated peptidase YedK